MLTLLRLALGLYFVGLVHSVLSVFRKKETFFVPAAIAMIVGFVCHATYLGMKAYALHTLPLTQLCEGFPFFAALAVPVVFIVYWKYRIPSLGVFAFPMIIIAKCAVTDRAYKKKLQMRE